MATIERLEIDLPSDLVAGLRQSVRSGAFASESEAIETLRAFVAEGIADADAGRVVDAEEVYARVRARIEAIAANKAR